MKNNNRRRGFTLMEVLLVLGILGVIMAMVVPRVLGRQQHANADATRVSIGGLSQALKLYALDHAGSFPSSSEGLEVLIRQPSRKDASWKGPYLDKMPKDAWGEALQYRYPGTHNTDSFDISSAGPDRRHGTADDIGNWEERMVSQN
ncbi:MAG: type II secretion system major pseudopilin GspG [Planctomycetaceae bacterium]|nr:type II secretion system major pseudopilin GspG [Planctomycetaceae bacterium]